MPSHPVNHSFESSCFDYLYSGLKASSLKDKSSAFLDLLIMLSLSGIETYKFLSITQENLVETLTLYDRYKHFTLCLYPQEYSDLKLYDFDGFDVLRNIEKTSKGYGCQIWHSREIKLL